MRFVASTFPVGSRPRRSRLRDSTKRGPPSKLTTHRVHPANLIKIASLPHTGKGVGLHQHILREMHGIKLANGSRYISRPSYAALKTKWQQVAARPNAAKAFKENMRSAYASYFERSPDCKQIVDLVDDALGTKPCGL